MLLMLSPMVVLPIVGLSMLSEPFIISWVGFNYEESSSILSLLVFCFFPCFLSNPSSSYFIAIEKTTLLNRFNIFQPILYWLLIFFTVGKWGVFSFAISKGLIPIFLGILYWYSLQRFCKECWSDSFTIPNFENFVFTFNCTISIKYSCKALYGL